MSTCGLFVEIEAARDQEKAVEELLCESIPLVRTEWRTAAWFAVKFRRHCYGIFDVFPDCAARDDHLAGPVARALARHPKLFASQPVFHPFEVLADKLPVGRRSNIDHKAILMTLEAHAGREHELATFLRDARAIVCAEPETTAWFALRFESGRFGIFDAFPNNHGRIKHLRGKVPRELVKHTRLLGGIPKLSLLEVRAETFAP